MEPGQDITETIEKTKPQTRLLQWLFDTRISMRRYVLRAGLISLLPSLAIAFILAICGIITEETGPGFEGSPLQLIFLIVIVGPPIETLLMGLVLRMLSLITRRRIPLAATSAFVWACLLLKQRFEFPDGVAPM